MEPKNFKASHVQGTRLFQLVPNNPSSSTDGPPPIRAVTPFPCAPPRVLFFESSHVQSREEDCRVTRDDSLSDMWLIQIIHACWLEQEIALYF